MTVPDVHHSAVSKTGELLGPAPVRAGVICDYVEEQWPSMDLVGDMLCQSLAQDSSIGVEVTQLRPTRRRRFSRLPLLGEAVSTNADRLLSRFWDYPHWLAKEVSRFDVFHIVDHSYSHLLHGLPAGRTVVTCHDLDTFRCLLEPTREPRPGWFRFMTARILDGFRKAAYVIAVSEATRAELLHYGLAPADRIRVIPNGVHPAYTQLADPIEDAEARRLLAADSPQDFWLLNVGSNAPRKRLDLLLQVFAAVRREAPGVRLARVGGPLTEQQRQTARQLGVEDAIVTLPFLSFARLAAVYRRATLLLHTADAEGFGLPLVEAMACGCPVVASDLPVLREVAGPGAVFCPVGEISAWAESIQLLVNGREKENSRWKAQQQLGIRRSALYQWTTSARETAQVYREILGESGRDSAGI